MAFPGAYDLLYAGKILAVRARVGAPNVDGDSRWVAPGLFRRLSDGVPLHTILGRERLVARETW
jgi:hypothetical protein